MKNGKYNVAISKTSGSYPVQPPYHPDEKFPEYQGQNISRETNDVYRAVRENFRLLGYDIQNFGTSEWNPLGHIIQPGQTVFVKPNFVDHKHRFGEDLWSVITHPSVIRAVCDFVAIALRGEGRIIIGDNPHVDTRFEEIRSTCSLDELQALYRKEFATECEIVDLRHWHMPDLHYYGFKSGRVELKGDPKGFSTVDVGKKSLLKKTPFYLLRGTYTDRFETVKHHILNKHEYVFSNSILSADVYISIPKLKAHAKVGATLNLKGLIGTIANKNTLVHWRIGFPLLGGDEYPPPRLKSDYAKLYFQHLLLDVVPEAIYFRTRNTLNKTAFGRWYNQAISTESQRKKMLRGAWDKNDTIWRMTADVYNAFVKDITGFRKGMGWQQKCFSVIGRSV